MSAMAKSHEGKRCVSLGFARSGDTRQPVMIRLTVIDDDMRLTEMLDLDPKQFADLMSGLATWVDDGFAGHRGGAADITTVELLEIIEKYAEAREIAYYAEDQGSGPAVHNAQCELNSTRAHLLEVLGLPAEVQA